MIGLIKFSENFQRPSQFYSPFAIKSTTQKNEVFFSKSHLLKKTTFFCAVKDLWGISLFTKYLWGISLFAKLNHNLIHSTCINRIKRKVLTTRLTLILWLARYYTLQNHIMICHTLLG